MSTSMNMPHFSYDFGGVTFPFHQKIVCVPLANASGMKPSSTKGFMPMLRNRS